MTNNQRFAAEVAVLLTAGAVAWTQAAPPAAADTLTVRQVEIVDADNGNRTVLDGKRIQILDRDGRLRALIGLEGGDNNTVVRLHDNSNAERVALTSSFRFDRPGDPRGGAALTLQGDGQRAVFAVPHGTGPADDAGARVQDVPAAPAPAPAPGGKRQ